VHSAFGTHALLLLQLLVSCCHACIDGVPLQAHGYGMHAADAAPYSSNAHWSSTGMLLIALQPGGHHPYRCCAWTQRLLLAPACMRCCLLREDT
jgi:hypothetical protein